MSDQALSTANDVTSEVETTDDTDAGLITPSDVKQPVYFHCTEFNITMPVSECERRRTAVSARILGSIDSPQGMRHQFMTQKCLQCVVYQELLKPENLMTHEQMMARLAEVPSQKPGPTHTGNAVFYSISTPHVAKRGGYYSSLGR